MATMTTMTATTPRSRPQVGGELRADTPAGAAMVAAAERFADEFMPGAAEHDRTGRFATAHLDALRDGRFLFAPVPGLFGGGGVTSVRDVLVAASRLARGDAATTIGVNMHFAAVSNLVRQWRVACARDDAGAAEGLGHTLRTITEAGVVMAAAVSEPGGDQDLTRPATAATRSEDGWVITGRKSFATMAPAATLLSVAVTFTAEDGTERYGFALVPTGTPGVVVHDDWDALGMRASASGSVSFDDVRLGAGAVRDGFPAGSYSTALFERYLVSGALHAAASVGIAESADAVVTASLRAKARAVVEDPHGVMRLAENTVDLAAVRATFDRAGRLIDEHHAAHPCGDAPLEAAQAVFAEVQAAKTFVNEATGRVVDRALALSGGAGYLAAHPLAKAWRDARAGAFMHPLGANRAYEFLARTALGLQPRAR
jgi:alkylation response protein AidB-like acyl-CoA dehydrogenase